MFARIPSHKQLAELAALLYLSEYTHARHLWRRHETAAASASTSDNPELHQFQLLWSAAQPMSTHDHVAAFTALDSCIASAMQPLATYAGEVRGKYHSNVLAKTIEDGYASISKDACRIMLGHTTEQEGDMVTMLVEERGWMDKGEYLIPYRDEEKEDEVGDENNGSDAATAIGAHGDHIRELANMVAFMEKNNLNL